MAAEFFGFEREPVHRVFNRLFRMAAIETGEVAATGCSHQTITDPTSDKS